MEENRGGKWVRVSARRPSLIMAFPRHLGTVIPVSMYFDAGAVSGPLPKGSILYVAVRGGESALTEASDEGPAGCLYHTLEDFTGVGRPKCAELFRQSRAAVKGSAEFILDMGDDERQGDSLAPGNRPWEPAVASLWVANHFVTLGLTTTGGRRGAGTSSLRFEVAKAEREIGEKRLAISRGVIELKLTDPKLAHLKEELLAGMVEEEQIDKPMSRLRERAHERAGDDAEADGEEEGRPTSQLRACERERSGRRRL